MTEQLKEDHREALLNTIEALIDINYKILELLDRRLTTLEDYVDFDSKKEGNEG